eukprot:4235588-Prymnesium_polylepis.2
MSSCWPIVALLIAGCGSVCSSVVEGRLQRYRAGRRTGDDGHGRSMSAKQGHGVRGTVLAGVRRILPFALVGTFTLVVIARSNLRPLGCILLRVLPAEYWVRSSMAGAEHRDSDFRGFPVRSDRV